MDRGVEPFDLGGFTVTVSISLGPLALTYILTVGGCGYFRLGTARPFLEDGRLYRVPGAPEFSHSAYAVYAERGENDLLHTVRRGLKQVAQGRERPGLPEPFAARTLPRDNTAGNGS